MVTQPPVRRSSETREAEDVVADTSPSEASKPKSSVRQRLERLFADYGSIAIATYFGIFFMTWGGFASAIALGIDVDGAAVGAGTIGAAWLATKVTQPVRIGATVLLTPLVARAWHRVRPRPARVVAVSEPTQSREDAPQP